VRKPFGIHDIVYFAGGHDIVYFAGDRSRRFGGRLPPRSPN